MNAPTRPASLLTELQRARLQPKAAPGATISRGPGWELQPDAPITPRRRLTAWRYVRRAFVLLAFASGCYWIGAGDSYGWRDRAIAELTALAQSMALSAPNRSADQAPSAAQPKPGARLAEEPSQAEAMSQSQAPASPAAPVEAPATLPEHAGRAPAAAAIGSAYTSAARQPDALDRRAAAAGLHTDISRAVLQRLSAADFDNAGAAITKAIAETPDDGMLVWPRQRKPELALFQVHFVPGAAPDCRRYVVTITKDNWMTTALPMERCGVKTPRPRRS